MACFCQSTGGGIKSHSVTALSCVVKIQEGLSIFETGQEVTFVIVTQEVFGAKIFNATKVSRG